MSSGFSNVEFTTDTYFGIRAFKWHHGGTLHPLFHRSATFLWLPGVNVAGCSRTPKSKLPEHMSSPYYPKCTCGFYSYYSPDEHPSHVRSAALAWDRRSHFYDEELIAVVENTGNIVLGTKGMRAEKSEIKAILCPGYETKRSIGPYSIILFIGIVLSLVLGIVLSPYLALACIPILGKFIVDVWNQPEKLPEEVLDKIKRTSQFYEVPVYSKMSDMLKDFPLSYPPEDSRPHVPSKFGDIY